MYPINPRIATLAVIQVLLSFGSPIHNLLGAEYDGLAPIAVASIRPGTRLAVLGSRGRQLVIVEQATGELIRTIPLPAAGSGLVIQSTTAYVTTSEPAGRVLAVDLESGEISRQIHVGHTPMAPALGTDGQSLFVANRFDHSIGMVHLASGHMKTVGVVREPVDLAISPDGRRLFAANHLPCVRPFLDDENPYIGAEVSVIDTGSASVMASVHLPNGSQGVRGITISHDGRYLVVTHIASNYTKPTLRVDEGAMNRNALSLVSTETLQWMGTAVLDDPHRGAANPWAVAFSPHDRHLLVTHAGTQELSVIDFPALLRRLAAGHAAWDPYGAKALQFMSGIRRRIRLPVHGPRALLVEGNTAFVPGYFSDDLAVVSWVDEEPAARVIRLVGHVETSQARLGERYFNDASRCFQQWQSCATCHPDGRSDCLHWDLLNDGVGNTKNTKSLLMSARTPPVMWRGVRADSAMAVRSGIRHIQFSESQPEQAEAIEAYLRHMSVVPSPRLNADVLETPKTEDATCAKCHHPGVPRGTLTQAAARGKTIFEGAGQCASCHPHPTFTIMRSVDPGLGSGVEYDVPSLIEAWRTAPYLHSGDALSLRETITDHNLQHKRGRTRELTNDELSDLLEYLHSL